MPTIVLASRNRKKAVEFAELLAPHGIELQRLSDFPAVPEVVESGTTFAENAELKASQTARALGCWTLADDSGLMVDALDGAPGIYSARYAGTDATDAENRDKLLCALANVPDEQRQAQFVCHLAVADNTGAIRLSASGSCPGLIIHEHRGDGGFGYDPLFLVPEYQKTFAELSLELKSHISHRAHATRQLIPQLVSLLDS
jgi:XTP/dITP diphosphohydrolase